MLNICDEQIVLKIKESMHYFNKYMNTDSTFYWHL
jgi:hypothetical protein